MKVVFIYDTANFAIVQGSGEWTTGKTVQRHHKLFYNYSNVYSILWASWGDIYP